MISRLQEVQDRLPNRSRSDEILMNKLLDGCKGAEACRLARQKPARNVEGIIADLQT